MKLLRTFAARRNSGVECVFKHHVPRVSGQYRPHLNRHLGVADASARVGEAEGAAGSEPKELALPNGDLRIGAKEEGTLRQHMITWTERLRDTAYYSIPATEWPGG